MQLTTTLNRIKAHNPCSDGWRKLLKYLGKTIADDEPLPFSSILDSNGLEDALWCCRTAPEHNRVWRLYALWCARQIQRLMTDPRSLDALDVTERHANGQADDEELSAAGKAAKEAAWDAWTAARAARDTTGAAWVAESAAWTAAWVAQDDPWAAAQATAETAQDAVGDDAWVVREAARAAQAAKFREMVSGN